MSDEKPTTYRYVVSLTRIFASPSSPPGDYSLEDLGDTNFVFVEARHEFEAICLAFPGHDWPCDRPDLEGMEDQNDIAEAESDFTWHQMAIFQYGFKLTVCRIPEDGEFVVRDD